jgi:hypothetical protein
MSATSFFSRLHQRFIVAALALLSWFVGSAALAQATVTSNGGVTPREVPAQ